MNNSGLLTASHYTTCRQSLCQRHSSETSSIMKCLVSHTLGKEQTVTSWNCQEAKTLTNKFIGGGKWEGVMLWRVEVKWVLSLLRKMTSDSSVLTLVGTLFHHWGARTEQSCEFTGKALFPLSDSGTSRPADVVLMLWRVVWQVFGGRWVQFHWWPWRPVLSSWIGCRLQQEASGGHGGRGANTRIWADWKWGLLQHSWYTITV